MRKITLTLDRLIDLRYDKIFKAVFTQETPASRKALTALLESCLNRRLDVVTVIANEPAAQSEQKRQIRYDIACTFNNGELADVEVTLWPKGTEPLRIEYYLSRLFVSQNLSGIDKDFGDLKQSYQISILGDNLYADSHVAHWFEYYDPERKISLGGRTAIVTLELNKLEGLVETPPEQMNGKERWGLFLGYASEPGRLGLVNKLLEVEEGIAMAGEAILQLPKSQIEEIRRISREKFEVDQRQARHDVERAKREAEQAKYDLEQVRQEVEQVRQEAEQAREALKQAKQEQDAALRENARNLKKLGIPIDQIAQGIGLSVEDIEKL
ncbi:MAG: PD-(D/E)XK nuclease family transposase [Treponema sp.]|jgi:predicted transposase/invertase (TIGR01784 family)|nr:PD-(D/E)XK nuclease family transposase [Treponema sp.]